MLFSSLFHERKRSSRYCRRRLLRAQPVLECLESRNLLSAPAIVNVNTDTEGVFHAETTLAVNPTNPLNLIGSANEVQASYNAGGQLRVSQLNHAHVSFDGGHTWTEYPIPFSQSVIFTSDPSVAFDADGTAYLAVTADSGPLLARVPGTNFDLVVTHSADGGKSWSGPVPLAVGEGVLSGPGIYNDKPSIAAWGHGNAIVTWSQIHDGQGGLNNNLSAPILARVTHDGGNTWTDPVQISGSFPMNEASVPVVAADGSIYVAFYAYSSGNQIAVPGARNHYKVVKVNPATGQALADPVEVGLIFDGSQDYPVSFRGVPTLQDSEFTDVSWGNITADPSNARHLAVVWSDMRDSTTLTSSDPYHVKTNCDIIVSQSFDAGTTWSAPTAIQQPNDQFQPWSAYDTTGHLQIGYYDRSYDPANHKYGYTLASETTPGSLSFGFQQVSTALSDPTQGDAGLAEFSPVTVNSNFPNATGFMGDYSAIAVTPTGVGALWTDMRLPSTFPGFPGSGEDAFFALLQLSPARGFTTPPMSMAAAGMTSPPAGPGAGVAFLSPTPVGAAFSAPSVEDPIATMPTASIGGEAEQDPRTDGLMTALASPGAGHRSKKATEVLFSSLARDEGLQPPLMPLPPMGSAINFDTSS